MVTKRTVETGRNKQRSVSTSQSTAVNQEDSKQLEGMILTDGEEGGEETNCVEDELVGRGEDDCGGSHCETGEQYLASDFQCSNLAEIRANTAANGQTDKHTGSEILIGKGILVLLGVVLLLGRHSEYSTEWQRRRALSGLQVTQTVERHRIQSVPWALCECINVFVRCAALWSELECEKWCWNAERQAQQTSNSPTNTSPLALVLEKEDNAPTNQMRRR